MRSANHDDEEWIPLQPLEDTVKRTLYLLQPDPSFGPNVVKNQKYSMLTFLPIVLYQQFKFFFNLYFLLVACSQFFKALQIGYLFTYFGPLCFVLTVTLAHEAWDDYKRYLRDLEANSQTYQVYRNQWISVASCHLCVGDVIQLHKNQRVPADCVLLTAPTECYIRTDQLDGETDWKLRIPVSSMNESELVNSSASVQVEMPSKDIHSFSGIITWVSDNGARIDSLSIENTLWMNTVLASEGLALVIYTGKDTRACMNTSFPRTKIGLLDLEINQLSKILAIFTLSLSFLMVALEGFNGVWYVYIIRFLILFSSIIPISLRVNLDMGKTVFSWWMMKDSVIPNTIVRTSTIPEELGRIDFLLSDKTGTLTKNEMELKKLHMGTLCFGPESKDEMIMHLHSIEKSQFNRGKTVSDRVKDVTFALALCHNVTPCDGTYQASSPDEVAIVKWTESVGLKLFARDLHQITLKFGNSFLLYEILEMFPFTSESKRMGIIVKDKQTKEIIFYQKGADNVLSKMVQYNDWLEEETGNMAREGLRTLVVARKRLSEDFYLQFVQQLNSAKASISDRGIKIQHVMSAFLEKDLELLGLTGVEDKLQEDVKLSLELFRNAGLKIWMLTGDKVETATCIAQSSRLVSRSHSIHTITKLTDPRKLEEQLTLTAQANCLVIDGESLDTFLKEIPFDFMSVVVNLNAVVCCRASPTQKAQVAEWIKSMGKRVCAIGDGGNDVSMIQAAHVGIGIVGKEGKQASLAADVSITQFSYLVRLLLWHGRNSYQASAKLAQFVIHRGLIISIIQAVFSALFYFAPIAIYQGMLVVGYATLFTMAPVFSLVLDRDISDDTAMLYPELYKELTKGRSLTLKTFLKWLFISVYQGGTIMMLAIWLFENQFNRIVSISFTALIFNELLMVALEITTWHLYMVYSLLTTSAVYVISMILLPDYFDMSFILTTEFSWKVGFITAISCFPLYIYKCIHLRLKPPSYTKLQ